MNTQAAEAQDDTLSIVVDDAAGAEGAGAAANDGGEGGDDPEAERLAESVASMMGWKGEEHWKGDKANFKSASQFLKEVPEVLKNTRKTLDTYKGKMDRIVGTVAKLQGNQRTDQEAAAIQALKDAYAGGSEEDVIKAAKALQSVTAPADEPPAALAEFQERNADWFNIDPEATAYAAALDQQYAKLAGGKITDPEAHMLRVEAGVKKRFPEHFGEAKADEAKDRKAPPLINRGARGPGLSGGGPVTPATMTPGMRAAAKEVGVSEATYLRSYNALHSKDAK